MSELFSTWGLGSHHENPSAHWGARAIYKSRCIDILWDRQCLIGSDENEMKKLAKWIDKIGMPKLRKLVAKEWLAGDEDRMVRIEDEKKGYYIEANPRKSYGYLYIGAGKI